ncbi:hypothetical protein JJB98_10520 [Bradyrhizobium diazoefficiens]|nr:hypothetical protein [Bradyrhizobium diazoefficiens]QQO20313.1 hypothetical protein JJB98_10520 [Bradyrhizobium diazoefficiens]
MTTSTTLDPNGIVLTGDNNYSGDYNFNTFGTFHVLGGANSGGQTVDDTGDGNEVFMFGNLQYKGTTFTENNFSDDTTHTYQSTATGTSNDTLHFGFTFPGSGGTESFFDSTFWNQATNGDGDNTYETDAALNGVNNKLADWQAVELTAGATLSGSQLIEYNESSAHNNGTTTLTNVTATLPGEDTPTADHAGAKTLLGFSVGSDHIALDTVTQDQFNTYFTVASTTHTSTNGNVVNDTTITLTDGHGIALTGDAAWSVDLYGVNTTAVSGDLHDYAWNNIIQHA